MYVSELRLYDFRQFKSVDGSPVWRFASIRG